MESDEIIFLGAAGLAVYFLVGKGVSTAVTGLGEGISDAATGLGGGINNAATGLGQGINDIGNAVGNIAEGAGLAGGAGVSGAVSGSRYAAQAANAYNITIQAGIGDPEAIARAVEDVVRQSYQRGTSSTGLLAV